MTDAHFRPDRSRPANAIAGPRRADRADRAGNARGPDAPRGRPRPAVAGPGRRRRPCGTVRHGRRPGGLCPDAAQWRDRAERPSRALAAGRPDHDRRRRDAARPAPGTGLGRPDESERPARRAVRAHQLRPHRVHRHEPLDRSRDRDLRHHPDQPAASRRPRRHRRRRCGSRSPRWPPRRSSMRRLGRRQRRGRRPSRTVRPGSPRDGPRPGRPPRVAGSTSWSSRGSARCGTSGSGW